MESVQLSSGTIEYEDSGGDGPVIVLVGGLLMDATLWRDVVPRLLPAHRCVVPVLPLGGHRRPMDADADLSLHGHAALLAEFIERLDLQRGHARRERLGRAADHRGADTPSASPRSVLLPEEAFDNIPPGLPGKVAGLAGRVPGGIFPVAQTLRVPFMRRLPFTFGWMAKRPIPADVMASWIRGVCTDRRVRRDVAKYVRTSDNEGLQAAAAGLAQLRSSDARALGSRRPGDAAGSTAGA